VNFRNRDKRFKTRSRHKPKLKGKYGPDKFSYDDVTDSYICPAGKPLRLDVKRMRIDDKIYRRYRTREGVCEGCKLMEKCFLDGRGKRRSLSVYIKHITPSLSHKMIDKIDRPESRRVYEKRIAVVEPVFGNIRSCKQMNRFTLRGRLKVDTQWLMYCMVHNMEKLCNFGFAAG